MTTLQTLLGSNVRRLRSARGLTQSALADAIERSKDLVSRIERGSSAPSFETLESLAAALDVPVAALFGAEVGFERREPTPVSDLQRLVDGLSAEEIGWLTELLRVARARPRR